MSPLVAIGVAIVVNVGVLCGGVIWLRRQMKRVVAERAAQDRHVEARADAQEVARRT